MQDELEKETQRVTHDKKINDIINSICHTMVETGRQGRDWGKLNVSAAKVRELLKALHTDFDTLKELLKDDPEKLKAVKYSEQKVYNIEDQLSILNKRLRSASMDEFSDIVTQARKGLNAEVDGVISSGILKIAEDTKVSSAEDKSAELRENIRLVLKLALGVSVAVALTVAILFAKNMALRLSRLSANAARLAKGEKLLPRIPGNDEIADLDKTLHLATAIINDAKEKERVANEELDKIRREVTAMVTHDLKTPLQTISTYFEFLGMSKFGELNKRGTELLAVAHNSSQRMSQIIESVLELEKIRSGKAKLNLERVDIAELLTKSAESVALLADSKQIKITLQAPQTMTFVKGDMHWLQQVMVNLLANAVNYSPENTAVLLSATKSKDTAFISVADQGPGIPDEEKELVFEKFQRLDATAKTAAGSGLGLTFCKEMITLHQGEIKVEDNEPRGTKFVVALPLYQES